MHNKPPNARGPNSNLKMYFTYQLEIVFGVTYKVKL